MKTHVQQPKMKEAVQPKAGNQAAVKKVLSGYVNNIPQQQVMQRQERKTTIYEKTLEEKKTGNKGKKDTLQVWKKNMEIIDSESPSDYVHLSRSTTSDPESFSTSDAKANALDRDGTRGTKIETTPTTYARTNFTEANNAHITLEGRYVDVLHSIINNADNSEGIKRESPASKKGYVNLNFGKQSAITANTIQNVITNVANDAKTHVPADFVHLQADIDQAIDNVRDSTLAFANNLITSTPFLNTLNTTGKLNHYGGTMWAPVW